jgi:hypothetical protein
VSSPDPESRVDDWPPERIKRWLLRGAGAGALSYVVWAVAVWWLSGAGYAKAGAFGDSFAPLSGLLSALTLAAVVLTVFMQRSELAMQRKDLIETRAVFLEQQKAQEAQALAQAKANTLAEERLEFERERFSWEIKVQDAAHVRSIAAAEATALATRATAYELVLRMRDTGGVLTQSERKDLDEILTETGRVLGALDELRAVSLLHVPHRKTTPL